MNNSRRLCHSLQVCLESMNKQQTKTASAIAVYRYRGITDLYLFKHFPITAVVKVG